MKIHFTQSGGFTGAVIKRTVDWSQLGAKEQAAVKALIQTGSGKSGRGGRDLVQYRFLIEGDSGETILGSGLRFPLELNFDDSNLPEAGFLVVERLRKL